MQRFIYRFYRRLKKRFLTEKPSIVGKLFFFLLRVMDRVLATSGAVRHRGVADDSVWRSQYQARYHGDTQVRLKTDHPVAVDAADTRWPRGAVNDSSMHPPFIDKVEKALFSKGPIRVLDLGCAGGGMVREFLERGHEAVGLEGSDAPERLGLGEWRNCPLHLFTCDISSPFRLVDKAGSPMFFDLVTAWEVLEHIAETKISILVENIASHLAPGGVFVGSVDMAPDGDLLTGAVYHVTLKPREWWLSRFRERGFEELLPSPFTTREFVRGNGLGLRDWDPADGEGFHLVLRLA